MEFSIFGCAQWGSCKTACMQSICVCVRVYLRTNRPSESEQIKFGRKTIPKAMCRGFCIEIEKTFDRICNDKTKANK